MKELVRQVLLFIVSILSPLIVNWLLQKFPGLPITVTGLVTWLSYFIGYLFAGTRLEKIKNHITGAK